MIMDSKHRVVLTDKTLGVICKLTKINFAVPPIMSIGLNEREQKLSF